MSPEPMTDLHRRLIEQGHNIEWGTGGPCEKCWADAYMRTMEDTSKSQQEHYEDIILEAENDA